MKKQKILAIVSRLNFPLTRFRDGRRRVTTTRTSCLICQTRVPLMPH
jgi:hypothetical protein